MNHLTLKKEGRHWRWNNRERAGSYMTSHRVELPHQASPGNLRLAFIHVWWQAWFMCMLLLVVIYCFFLHIFKIIEVQLTYKVTLLDSLVLMFDHLQPQRLTLTSPPPLMSTHLDKLRWNLGALTFGAARDSSDVTLRIITLVPPPNHNKNRGQSFSYALSDHSKPSGKGFLPPSKLQLQT